MSDVLIFTYKLVQLDSFYIFYFALSIGMGAIVGYFASKPLEGKVLRSCMFSGVLILHFITALGILSPEDTYKETIFRKNDIKYTLTNCKISAFDAQQGFNGKKDAWACPDGITRYLPVKYRGKGISSGKNKDYP
ncbi:hypothetical protein [Klebsiella sp. CN_Kp116]|uniref:hypothetical protein n=1 Tax=unclassified Klebsiella TaxID=2608929 RepID=UPI0032B3DECB